MSDRSLAMRGVLDLLHSSPEFQLVGVFQALPDVVALKVRRLTVLVVDPFVLGRNPAELTQLPRTIPALAFTESTKDCDVKAVLAAGAKGFVRKSIDATGFRHAVTAVSHGGLYLDGLIDSMLLTSTDQPAIPAQASGTEADTGASAVPPATASRITPREREVLTLVAQGLTHKEVACALQLSKATVDTYVYRISQKLGGANKAQLTRLAMDLELTLDVGATGA